MRAAHQVKNVRCSDHRNGAVLLLVGTLCWSTTVSAQRTDDREPSRVVSTTSKSLPAAGDTTAGMPLNRIEIARAASGVEAPVLRQTNDPSESVDEVDADQDVRIGTADTQYVDPEFSSTARQMVFQTHVGSVWVGDVDPRTGLLLTASGKDHLLATGAAPLITTAQGPEFGRDRSGISIYFTKMYNLRLQLWRSRLADGGVMTERVTSGITPRRTVFATGNPELDSVRLLYLRGSAVNFSWASADENDPSDELLMPEIISGISGPRWIPGTDDFIYLTEIGGSREIARTNSATGETRILTNDGGNKVDMFPFRAPEFDNEVLFFSNVNQTELAVYRDLGGAFYERILTLVPPANCEFQYMVSVEPFTAGGRTYFAMELHKTAAWAVSLDSSIWVFDMNADAETRLTLRVDDGSVAHRVEAEWFIGRHEVFIYYSVVDYLGRWELHRTRTGISTHNPLIPADLDGDGDVDEDDAAVLAEDIVDGNFSSVDAHDLGGDINGDGRVNENDVLRLEECMGGPYRPVPAGCIE